MFICITSMLSWVLFSCFEYGEELYTITIYGAEEVGSCNYKLEILTVTSCFIDGMIIIFLFGYIMLLNHY